MPRPGSRTATPTTPLRTQPSTAISPPSGEYLIAFESRFASTCLSRLGSAAAASASSRGRAERLVGQPHLERVDLALRGEHARLVGHQRAQVDPAALERKPAALGD